MSSITFVTPTQLLNTDMFQRYCQALGALMLPHGMSVQLVLVVNAHHDLNPSQKQILECVEQLAVKSTVVFQGTNTGFAAATNAGIRASRSDFIITLNDDAWVESDFLTEMIKKQQETGADMIASTIYQGETQEIDSCGFDFAWRGKAWPMTPVGVNWQKQDNPLLESPLLDDTDNWLKNPELLLSVLPHSTLKQPFGPDAAAALYSRKLFDTVGLFNEAFFAYLEDVDLALRARRAGLRCVWASQAVVRHQKHATSSQMGRFKQQQDVKNWWRIVTGSYPSQAWTRLGGQILLERIRNGKGLIV